MAKPVKKKAWKRVVKSPVMTEPTKKVVMPSVCDDLGSVPEDSKAFTLMQKQQLKTIFKEALNDDEVREGIKVLVGMQMPAKPFPQTSAEKHKALTEAGWHRNDGVHLPGYYWRLDVDNERNPMSLIEMMIVQSRHTHGSSMRIFREVIDQRTQMYPVTTRSLDIDINVWNHDFNDEGSEMYFKPFAFPIDLIPPGTMSRGRDEDIEEEDDDDDLDI